MFSANYIKGKVHAQPNGNFIGEVKFKIVFKSGGAIEFGQAMLKAAHLGKKLLYLEIRIKYVLLSIILLLYLWHKLLFSYLGMKYDITV